MTLSPGLGTMLVTRLMAVSGTASNQKKYDALFRELTFWAVPSWISEVFLTVASPMPGQITEPLLPSKLQQTFGTRQLAVTKLGDGVVSRYPDQFSRPSALVARDGLVTRPAGPLSQVRVDIHRACQRVAVARMLPRPGGRPRALADGWVPGRRGV